MADHVISRRGIFAGAAGAAVLAATGFPTLRFARAEGAAAGAKTAVAYSRALGDMTVTTLLDGYFNLGTNLVTNAKPEDIAAAYASVFGDPSKPMRLPIVAYVVRTGTDTVLIDSGAGAAFGPTSGAAHDALAAAGLTPDDITKVILTHMHPDHIGGLLAAEAAAFPKATLHVSKTDVDFWTSEDIAGKAPDAAKPFFALARGVAGAYGDRVTPFDGEADLGGGITAMPLPGHTVGHSGLRLSSGNAQMLIAGDAVAMAAYQFTHPDIGIAFDTDGKLAAETRRKMFDMVVADKLLVAATHLPFPGAGHIEKSGDAYAWVPEEWQFL
jgi:glyoxylase-like metal-dependent hydrolase (beta-lactamase superfamily II)